MIKYLNQDAPLRVKIRAVMITLQIWFILFFIGNFWAWRVHWENLTDFEIMTAMSVLGMGIFWQCWYWLNSLVSDPIERLTQLGEQLIDGGTTDVQLPELETRKDCTGRLYRVMLAFSDSLKKRGEEVEKQKQLSTQIQKTLRQARERDELTHNVIDQLGDALGKLAKGNLLVRINTEVFEGEFSPLKEAFNDSVAHLNDAMCAVSHNSELIAAGATEISEASDDLTKRTESQANELGGVTESVKSISGGITSNAKACEDADKDARTALDNITEVSTAMESTSAAMDTIREGSKAVSEIVGVIDNLAFQTNVLALNASVEAARAGDAGKGFAVVAQEVRTLAEQSSKSASEIRKLVSDSSSQVDQGVNLVSSTKSYFEEFNKSLKNVAGRIAEIAKATRAQSERITGITQSVSNMDKVTKQNAAMVDQVSSSSHNLTNETGTLSKTLGLFKIKVAYSEKQNHGFDGQKNDGGVLTALPKPEERSNPLAELSSSDESDRPVPEKIVQGINGKNYSTVASDEGWEDF